MAQSQVAQEARISSDARLQAAGPGTARLREKLLVNE
jgi:hypothetical protein